MDDPALNPGQPKLPPPPPLPPGKTRSGNSFAHQAAKVSLWAPFIVFFLNMFTSSVIRNHPDSSGRMAGMAIITLGGLMLLSGLILGIAALCRMEQYGRKGILGRSVTGVILNLMGLCALLMIPFMHKMKERTENQKAYAEMSRSIKELNEEAKQELKEGSGDSSATDRLNRMQQAIQNAAQEMKGEDALVAKAGQAYVQKMQKIVGGYTKALTPLQKPPINDMSQVTKKEDLEAKRVLVKNFLAENEKFMAFIQRGEAALTEELQKEKISQPKIDESLVGYRKKAYIQKTILKIRETDVTIGESWLKLLDLLQENWGTWKYSPEKEMVVFENKSTLEKFNSLMVEIRTAANKQMQLQKQLAKNM